MASLLGALWECCPTLLTKFIAIRLWKSNKGTGSVFPVYLSNHCTCESPGARWILGWSIRPGINLSLFALSLFGRAVGWEWAFVVTWSGVSESHDKWCSLLTPSLGYLWLINWSERETCWRSRGRQRQASVALPQSGPQALWGKRE